MKGYVAPTWILAKEIMNPLTFKLELSLLDITSLKHCNMNRINTILSSHKNLNPSVI
jgi:hypothetical protein